LPVPTYAVSERAFGFEVEFNTSTPVVRVFAHNGTTLSTSAASTTLVNLRAYSALAVMDGSTVRLYINGAEVASVTGTPTGSQTGQSWAQWEIVQEDTAATGNITVFTGNPKAIIPVI
jgi:hypothetical protein